MAQKIHKKITILALPRTVAYKADMIHKIKVTGPESFSYFRHPRLGKKSRASSTALAVIICLLFVAGCARPRVIEPEFAFRQATITSETLSDDLHLAGLVDALEAQQRILHNSADKVMQFGRWKTTRGEYGTALDKLIAVLNTARSTEESLLYIRQNFHFLEWYGGSTWGEVLVTGYFEPVIPGSLTRTAQFSQALYARPKDLVTIDLKQFSPRFKDEATLRARIKDTQVLPYFSRTEIDSQSVLKGHDLELCWVNPVDAFFLQIQGSGTVRTAKGEEIHVTYAENNGHRYDPLGKYLKERLAPEPVTMQKIEEVAHAMSPKERADLFDKNPSYVFFKRSKERAITALGIPATPGRTIASDPKYAPRGSLAFIAMTTQVNPDTSHGDTQSPLSISRIVVNQDTGGAITGTDHIDLFWGRGDEAKKVAGVLQHKARMLFLFPKN